jgi:protein CpxP
MKNVVKKLVVAVALVFSIGISAQDRKEKIKNATPEERIAMRTDKLSEELGLDENQKKKVSEILVAQRKENQALREDIKMEREKVRTEAVEAMKKQQETLKAKMKTVLTEEQFKKWEALQNENKEKVKKVRKAKKEKKEKKR